MSGPKKDQVWSCEVFALVARQSFPASTAWYLSSVSGVNPHTVKKHLSGESRPSADHLLAYLGAGAFGARLRAILFSHGHPFPLMKETGVADEEERVSVSRSRQFKQR